MKTVDLRLGVVGCGWAGQEAIRSAQAVAGVGVVAISDLNAELREGAATAHGVDRQYGDYRELRADDAVDAVYLAVNPVMRHEMVPPYLPLTSVEIGSSSVRSMPIGLATLFHDAGSSSPEVPICNGTP